jgi:hypothetical protein
MPRSPAVLFGIGPGVNLVFNAEQFRYRCNPAAARRQGPSAIRKSRGRSTEVHSRRVQSEYAASQATKAGYQARIAQAFLDSRNEIATELTNPGLDILSFELGGEHLNELLFFRAMGKKDFHAVRCAGADYRHGSRWRKASLLAKGAH